MNRPSLESLQHGFTAYIRDPENNPVPPGCDPARMQQYARLFFNNVDGILSSAYQRLRRSLGEAQWSALTRQFFRDRPQHSPYLVDVPAGFLDFLDDAETELNDWQWALAELDLASFICRFTDENPELPAELDPHGDPLTQHPVPNPEGQLFASPFPVHRSDRIAADGPPAEEAAFLFLLRDAEGLVTLHELSPASARLLELCGEYPLLSGSALLGMLAEEFGVPTEQLTTFGTQQFRQWQADGLIAGTLPAF